MPRSLNQQIQYKRAPLWRITIEGRVFESRAWSPANALQSAFRKFLSGPVEVLSDGTRCHVMPPAYEPQHGETVRGIKPDGSKLIPMLPNDVTGGAVPSLAYDDMAIFIQRVDAGDNAEDRRRRAEVNAAIRRDNRNAAHARINDPNPTQHEGNQPLPAAPAFTDEEHGILSYAMNVVARTFHGTKATEETLAQVCAMAERECRDRGLDVHFTAAMDPTGHLSIEPHRIIGIIR